MELNLMESLYAYDSLHKQGNNLIHEMSNKELDSEDMTELKKFGYQYYYYYLFHYFNNLRRASPNHYNTSNIESPKSESQFNSRDMEESTMKNVCHTILMESVNLVQYYDVIPRDCALAPIKLSLSPNSRYCKPEDQIEFVFMWNMFDSSNSIKIFTQILCKDYGLSYNKSVSTEFERQIIESSIVECDFAMVIEMLALECKITWDFHQKFRKKIKIDLNPGKFRSKVYENVVWDLLSSDWEITDLVTGLIDDYGFEHDQIGNVIYYFKKDILTKKKAIIRKYREQLVEYSKIHDLRAPFISRNFNEDLYDDKPFLIYQKIDCSCEIKEMFRSSYKERLHLLSKFKHTNLIQ